MKVIGITNSGFLLEASNDEVKALLAVGDDRRNDVPKNIKVGCNLTFSVALQNLNAIKDARLSQSNNYLGSSLKDAKSYIDKAIAIVEGFNEPITILRKEIEEKSV